jgi:hypothetical protein
MSQQDCKVNKREYCPKTPKTKQPERYFINYERINAFFITSGTYGHRSREEVKTTNTMEIESKKQSTEAESQSDIVGTTKS